MVVAIYTCIYRLPVSFATWQAQKFYKPFPDKVCFRPVRLRDKQMPVSAARFGLFGLSLDGSPLQMSGNCLAPHDGFAACLSFDSSVAANSYYFETDGNPETDPVSWSVEAYSMSGNETMARRWITGKELVLQPG